MNYALSIIYLLILLGVVAVPCVALIVVTRYVSRRPEVACWTFVISLMLCFFLFFQWDSSLICPPTLIEDIQTGVISADKVRSIEFARPVPGLFASDERKHLQSALPLHTRFLDLAEQLTLHISPGREGRSHPTVISPDHSLIITLNDGSTYLLHCTVYTYPSGDFVSIDAWPKLTPPRDDREMFLRKWLAPGPLDSHYESGSFVDFIRKYDPWFGH